MKWRTPRSERFRGKFRCFSRAKVGARARLKHRNLPRKRLLRRLKRNEM